MQAINGAAASLIAIVLAAPALAGEIEAASRIESVIVYPDGAAVTRAVEMDLPQGISTVIFRGLPGSLDGSSLRVEGAAAARLVLGAVESRATPSPANRPDTAIEAKLKSLRGERESIQMNLAAFEAKKAMMLRFAQASPEKLSPEAKPLDIAQWTQAWDAVGAGLAKTGDDIRLAQQKARELDEEIRGLETARQRPAAQSAAARDVIVEVDSQSAQKGRLTLAYRIAGANWQPIYDARLDTRSANGKPSLELVRRAQVSQRTGEDWSGVALSVSTLRARRGVQAPDVTTQRLAFYEPPAVLQRSAAPMSAPAPGMAGDVMNQQRLRDEESKLQPARKAEEQLATLDAGAYQAAFQIVGRIDVPADGSRKTFAISTAKFTPELLVRASPSLDETAYLQARLKNEEDAPLLPGIVSIVRDGAYVGSGQIAFVAPGDSADIGFGADDRVTVKRVPIRRKENEPTWINQTKTEQREFRTSVKNLHDFPVRVSLVDRIPVSENTSIVVEALSGSTPPTEKIVNDQRGVMGWSFDLAPNQSRDINLGWRTKWPADRDVVFQNTAGAAQR